MAEDLLALAIPVTGVAAAGFLRGLSGFGFALAAVPLLTFTLPAREVVPLVAGLQWLSCLPALGRDRQDVAWRLVAILSLAALVGLLPGIMLLSRVNNQLIRLLIGLSVMVCIVTLASSRQATRRAGAAMTSGAGALAGLMQGLAGMAGPPVVLLLMTSDETPRTTRATLIAFFLFVSGAGFAGTAIVGLVTIHTFELILLCLPIMMIGQHAGRRTFSRLSGATYRRMALALLFVIAVTTVVSAAAHGLHLA